jgi:hypothetical protein
MGRAMIDQNSPNQISTIAAVAGQAKDPEPE